MAKRYPKKVKTLPELLLLIVILGLVGLYQTYFGSGRVISLENIPAYSRDAYVAVNGNRPFFTETD